jgi:hypothetical protein
MDDPLPTWLVAELADSIDRLVAAGLVERPAMTPAIDIGEVRLTHEVIVLLEAGRPPLSFPEFLELWDRSDYPAMRAWLKRKAAEFAPVSRPLPGGRRGRRPGGG